MYALNVWNTTTLTLEDRIIIFKTLGISKIVQLSNCSKFDIEWNLKYSENFFMVLFKT